MDTFQGNMNTILEYLQAQKATTSMSAANPASAVVTDAIAATTSIDAVVDTVIQPVVSQPIRQAGPSRGPTLHFRLPPRATQPTVQNLNQGVQIPPPHPGASSVVAPPFVYPGEPYAPHQNQYGQIVGQMINPDQNRQENYRLLDERIIAIDDFSAYGMDAKDLCLVPNVVLPPKFKAPDLPKYKGLSCPRSHVIMYCRKMASYIDNDDLLIHCFQDNLFGASLDWYIGLECYKIRSWKDLSEAFLKQYKYNLDMAPTRLQLQNQACKSSKTFKEYVQRWHGMASRVKPALTDVELVDIFMGTLQGLYYENMVGSSSSNFADMVTIGEHIKNGLKIGKIASIDSQSVAKKSQGFAKKKQVEENAVKPNAYPPIQAPMDHMPYYPYPYIAAAQHQKPAYQPQYQPHPRALVSQNQQDNIN
ncbi:uncharacterized protein LOC127102925 [Lathyrus oleraceus]|uniref:uncharacterized protein LOC127102925 n=1 Tax=Pisum sativum TaxID=3888 RepID=UPI0021D07A2E|nr:uncharacterized protein LOC127102925 [Pisum sativum]